MSAISSQYATLRGGPTFPGDDHLSADSPGPDWHGSSAPQTDIATQSTERAHPHAETAASGIIAGTADDRLRHVRLASADRRHRRVDELRH